MVSNLSRVCFIIPCFLSYIYIFVLVLFILFIYYYECDFGFFYYIRYGFALFDYILDYNVLSLGLELYIRLGLTIWHSWIRIIFKIRIV